MAHQRRVAQCVSVVGGVALMFAAGCAATGPAGPPDVVLSWSYDPPADVRLDPGADPPSQVVLTGDGRLQVVLFGSRTCPRFPERVTVKGPDRISIVSRTVDVVGNEGACTTDISTATSTIAIPAGVDVSQGFHVVVDGDDHVITPADS